MQGVGIGFELFDVMKGFPISSDEIILLGDGRFSDTRRRFGMIIE